MPDTSKPRKRRRYKSYAWRDKKTGMLYARVQLKQDDGTFKTIYKPADSITDATQIGEKLVKDHQERGQAFIDGRNMTFARLAEWYKENFVVAPTYIDGVKISGMRTWEMERNKIDRIVKIIGKEPITDIDEITLQRLRLKRLSKKIKLATLHRDFETIRAMLKKARKKKWITEVPDFEEFIKKSLEQRRTVTIDAADEKRILEQALTVKFGLRLYALILALRDSGARPNELYPVNDFDSDYTAGTPGFYEPIRWRDLFDENGEIRDTTTLVSYKGKIRQERIAIVSERMKGAFKQLWKHLQNSKSIPSRAADLDNLVFPFTTFKKSWGEVRKNAGMPDLRLRDLRRDWVTRLGRLGFSDKLAQRGAGHTKMQTSFEYTEFDIAAAIQAKELIDRDNQGH